MSDVALDPVAYVEGLRCGYRDALFQYARMVESYAISLQQALIRDEDYEAGSKLRSLRDEVVAAGTVLKGLEALNNAALNGAYGPKAAFSEADSVGRAA
jgi:hypothetical protein